MSTKKDVNIWWFEEIVVSLRHTNADKAMARRYKPYDEKIFCDFGSWGYAAGVCQQ